MYWNHLKYKAVIIAIMLNSNIRCIEIQYANDVTSDMKSWIVTLDVLKFS